MGNRTLRLSKTRAVLINSLSAIATLSLASSAGLAAGDRAAGQQFFTTHCSPCHATQPGVNKIGPSLVGVVGRKSGSEPGYNYSLALKAANITWDEKTLDQWLQNPTGDVHGAFGQIDGAKAASCSAAAEQQQRQGPRERAQTQTWRPPPSSARRWSTPKSAPKL